MVWAWNSGSATAYAARKVGTVSSEIPRSDAAAARDIRDENVRPRAAIP